MVICAPCLAPLFLSASAGIAATGALSAAEKQKGGSGYETEEEYRNLQEQGLSRENSIDDSLNEERLKREEYENNMLNNLLNDKKKEVNRKCGLLVELIDSKVKKGKVSKIEAEDYSKNAYVNKKQCDKDLLHLRRVTEPCNYCENKYMEHLTKDGELTKDNITPVVSEKMIMEPFVSSFKRNPKKTMGYNKTLVSQSRKDMLTSAMMGNIMNKDKSRYQTGGKNRRTKRKTNRRTRNRRTRNRMTRNRRTRNRITRNRRTRNRRTRNRDGGGRRARNAIRRAKYHQKDIYYPGPTLTDSGRKEDDDEIAEYNEKKAYFSKPDFVELFKRGDIFNYPRKSEADVAELQKRAKGEKSLLESELINYENMGEKRAHLNKAINLYDVLQDGK